MLTVSSYSRPNLFYERVYAPFLPAYNRTAYGPGDWAVVVNASAPISLLASTLRRIDADTVRRMQRRIVDISPGIQYVERPFNPFAPFGCAREGIDGCSLGSS